jgi:IclR family transcriptional regulator, mhp operon transcriptional activator
MLLLIETLNEFGELSVLELEHKTKMSRPAIYRLLDVLVKFGYVRRFPDRARFRLTPAVNELNSRVGYREALVEVATPLLNDLQKQIVWPVSLSCFHNGKMLTIVTTKQRSPFVFDRGGEGRRLPVLETAQGRAYLAYCGHDERKAILAFLKSSHDPEDELIETPTKVRRLFGAVASKGFAVRTGKYPANTSSIAVPVLVDGNAVAAISVSFLTSAFKMNDAVEIFLPRLLSTATAVAASYPCEKNADSKRTSERSRSSSAR